MLHGNGAASSLDIGEIALGTVATVVTAIRATIKEESMSLPQAQMTLVDGLAINYEKQQQDGIYSLV